MTEDQKAILALTRKLEEAQKRDREAAEYVESVIALRTGFNGEQPYVGWKGLGLALTERLDELEAENQRLREALAELMELTAAAYGQQVNEVPEYRKAKAVLAPLLMMEPKSAQEEPC